MSLRAHTLIRRLHDVMAARTPTQGKFDQVVALIADALQCQAVSIYLLRDNMLELYATHGLKKEAVHVTRLAMGQGLVGVIAANKSLLNLAEAASHPAFSYRPETGEEKFHSFAGVPIIRREQAIGVLAVQHVDPHKYDDLEIEALQTVAMVLAELIAAAGLTGSAPAETDPQREQGMVHISGLKLVEGLGRGHAVFHEPRVEIIHTVAEDSQIERQRLDDAFHRMRDEIDQMVSRAEFGGPGDHDEILETYKMFAFDEGWAKRILAGIDSGLTAEAAIDAVAQGHRVRLGNATDPYLRERLHDLEDLSNRLIRIVSGQSGTAAQRGLTRDTILIARNIGPAELLEYDRKFLKGVALEEGSATAHVTIIARAMGVPLLGRCTNLREQVAEGDPLLMNTSAGALFVRPSAAIVDSYNEQMELRERQQAEYQKIRSLPAVTLDGIDIQLSMNAGLRSDLPALELTNADGIGLFRTELQFLISSTLPRRGRQIELYREVLEAAGSKHVVFRTVDIGGDKAVPYVGDRTGREENPAMGWRALRLALERSALLAIQARALLEASAGRPLYLMFPMISEPWEFFAARDIVEERRARLQQRGTPHASEVRYGAMFEVPALAYTLDELLPHIDFLSIGTNDLVQFLLASDRSNPKLANRYDWLSRGVLRFLQQVFQQTEAAKVAFSVCGEMGGRPLEALALIALGARRISITPAGIGPIKAMIRSTSIGPLAEHMRDWLDTPGANIRELLQAWVAEQKIVIP